MIEIRRLNMDNSWQLRWDGVSLLLDPWLIGSEIDGYSWFNEQWHVTPPVSIAETGPVDVVIVSQPYSDHCHAETIKQLLPYGQVLAVKPAMKRLKSEIKELKNIEEIPDAKQQWLSCGPLQIAKLSPDRWIDPIYHAVIIRRGDDAVFYAPHGFVLTEGQLDIMRALHVRLLITTFTYFKLPAILGGVINLGVEAVRKLAAQIDPARIINTHDEQKTGKGIVMKIAQTKYADIAHHSREDSRVIHLDSYNWVRV